MEVGRMLTKNTKKMVDGLGQGLATSYREEPAANKAIVIMGYQEVSPGIFLLIIHRFKKDKFYFPDELRAMHLISRFARGKIVFWPKDVEFLDSASFLTGRAIDGAKVEELSVKIGIKNYDEYFWYQVSDISSSEVFYDYCR
jgi:hypothetical protein